MRLLRPQTYYITKAGVLQSLRKCQDGNIRIGKESIRDAHYAYNDIMLLTQDLSVSRSHCMINYQDFFRNNLSEPFITFLMGGHNRVGHRSILLNLPQNLFKYILDFLLEPRFPILISPDNPSYLRLSNIYPYTVYPGLVITVGNDIFLRFNPLDSFVCEICINRSNDKVIRLEAQESQEHVVGRKEFADHGILEGRISRVQFRVQFCNGLWAIMDGAKDKPTVNGTWILVGPSPVPIPNKGEIKISEYVLKLEW